MQTTATHHEQPGTVRTVRARHRGGSVGTAAIVAGALLLILLHLLDWGSEIAARGGLDGQAEQTDFCATLIGALLVREGRGPALYDFAAQRGAQATILGMPDGTLPTNLLPYIHPPYEALIVAPLLDLPHGALYLLWTLLNLAALVAGLAILARAFPLPPPLGLIAIATCCSFSPLLQGFALGQSTPLLLLGLVGAYVALARGRDAFGGAALALVVLKPQLLLVVGLLLLLQRRWRALATCALVVALVSAAALPALGPLWPLEYARFLAGIGGWSAGHNEYPQIMYNWRGLLTNLLGDARPGVFGALLAALTAASLGALALAWWRSRGASGADAVRANDLLWALAIPVAILAAPHLYIHDLALLILPAWLALRLGAAGAWGGALGRAWPALLGFGYLVALCSLFRSEQHSWWPVVPGILVVAALAGLLAWRATTIPGGFRPAARSAG